MTNLWSSNTPANFWLCQPEPSEHEWLTAIRESAPILGLPVQPDTVDALLSLVLGEGQFGPDHWQLGPAARLYYGLKPALPGRLVRSLRTVYGLCARARARLCWPIEDRYVLFQWELMRWLLTILDRQWLSFTHFWPDGHQYAFALTHDVETAAGAAFVRAVVDLEESLGFRSSFNFVPEGYAIDNGLLQELRQRGFEIGVHGLTHDCRLFSSYPEFMRKAERINGVVQAFGAAGFRSPSTHRHPEWMQALEIEYDLSFFDTDPFEPLPGGTMSIWPFTIGRFVELPYTLVQDHTLVKILGEKTPRLWLQKVDFIERYHGMALVDTHPDYLLQPAAWKVYSEFLQSMKTRGGYWHALPQDVARWWRARSGTGTDASLTGAILGKVQLGPEGVSVTCPGASKTAGKESRVGRIQA